MNSRSLRRHYPQYCALLLAIAPAAAAANPYTAVIEANYRESGVDYVGHAMFPSCAWVATDTGWCSHFTSASHKYTHADIPSSGFPFFDAPHNKTVTTTNVKAFYDFHDPGNVFVSPATCQRNCHGFTTGKTQYIDTGLYGVLTLRSDDYAQNGSGTRVFANGNFDCSHSYKIMATQACGSCGTFVTEEQEKWNSSPVYKRTYVCSDAQGTRSGFTRYQLK